MEYNSGVTHPSSSTFVRDEFWTHEKTSVGQISRIIMMGICCTQMSKMGIHQNIHDAAVLTWPKKSYYISIGNMCSQRICITSIWTNMSICQC